MIKGIFYPRKANIKKDSNGFRFTRWLLLSGVIFFSIPAMAINNPPSFVNGYSQVFVVCENTSSASINSLMPISDVDFGQTETWSVLSGPLHGVIGGSPFSAPSNGAIVTPAGLTYSPASGYSGNDTFTMEISDGFDTATTNIIVTIKALPTLSSTLAPPSICGGSLFSYTPTSLSPGATFNWSRAFVGGILNPSASGTNNPNETLISNTYYPVPVIYIYTIVANGCTNHQNVAVTVKPAPQLSSSLNDTICSGATFNYSPSPTLSGTTYSWSRAAVAGISPATSSGSGNINEALVNNTLTSLKAVYTFELNDSGCTSSVDLKVTVNPQPAITTITAKPLVSVCSGTNNQNFGAGMAPPSGITYNWSAVNANIAATGKSSQYCIVNFPSAGNAVITLTFTVAGSGCVSRDTFAVNVGSGAASSSPLLYYNSQFIYLDNSADSYHWGYDDAATLDSNLIQGATFQSYPNSNPDLANKYYWVITTKTGCLQKTYYNAPSAITNIAYGNQVSLKVYPNPASNTISVDMHGTQGSVTNVAITDLIGQTIITRSGTANNMQFDIADLPAGCYFVSCSQNGVKTAVAQFIKN